MEYVEKTYSAYNNQYYAYELEIASNLNIIWLKLIKNLKDKIQTPSKKVSLDDERVKTAINYIKSNYTKDISTQQKIPKQIKYNDPEICNLLT